VVAQILEQPADQLIRIIRVVPVLPVGVRVAQEEKRPVVISGTPVRWHSTTFQPGGRYADIG
jgi:hypothetical protein